MTIQTPTNGQDQPTTQDPNLDEMPFIDYEKMRRGEKLPVKEAKSAQDAKASLQKESPESDTEETEVDEETKDQVSEQDAEESEEGDEEEAKKDDKPAKKKGGFQRRIDKLNAAKAKAEQEAEYWRRLATEKSAGSDKEKPAVESNAAPEGKPDPETFDTHAEYVEALTEWKIEQREKVKSAEAQKTQLKTEHEKRVQAYVEKQNAFKAEHQDFDDVLEAVDHIPLSPTLNALILKNGPEIAYELAKNPEELKRINALGPLDAAEEFGLLKAKVSTRTSDGKTKEPKKTTQAPKPIDPVGSAKTSVNKNPEDMTFAEYERHRRQQMKRRGR